MLQADALLEKIGWQIRKYAVPFFATLIIGFASHGFAMTNKLLNHDEVATLFYKGATVDSGRWGLELTPLVFPNFSMPWIYGIVSLLLIALAVCLMVDLFDIRSKALQLLLGGLMVTYPVVTATFTYMFTLSSYMLAFFLAVAGPYLICRREKWGAWLLGIGCIVLSAGIYQAYIAVAASLLVLYLLRLVLNGEHSTKQVLIRGAVYVFLLGLCLGLYWGINVLAQEITGIGKGSYAASAESTHGILWRVVQAYGAFALSLITGLSGLIPTVWGRCLHLISMGIALALLVGQLRRQKGFDRKLLLAVLVCLLPLAMNSMYLIAGSGAIHTLVLYSNASIYILAAMLLDGWRSPLYPRLRKIVSSVAGICMALVIVCNTYLANQVYLQLHLRYENHYAMCTDLLTQMRMTPGYSADLPVLLTGYQSEPEYLAAFSDLEQMAGSYGVSINNWSRDIFFQYYCGVELPKPTQAQIEAVEQSAEFAAMPCYPDNGSVGIIDNVMVIKLSAGT